MFINSINGNTNVQIKSKTFKAGIKPETARNQMKILLSQDCWAPRLKVRMPETALEKEVLLEMLKNRLKLDRFVRLTNERFATKGKIIIYNELLENNSNAVEKENLKIELEKKGNLPKYFDTLNKQIEIEEKKNIPALKYFDEIENVKEIYLSKKVLNEGKIKKFYDNIVKNNINKDEQYTTQELINIIENGKVVDNVDADVAPKILSKKQLLTSVESLYEDLLRQYVNVYQRDFRHFGDAKKARGKVEETYKDSITKYPDVKKSLAKIYENIERKFIHKVDRIANMDIYPIGEIWKDMVKVEAEMRNLYKEIKNLKQSLEKAPADEKILNSLATKEHYLSELKKDWINGMRYSFKYENINNERMIEAGNKNEYEYIAGKNPTILKHKYAAKIYEENNNSIPEQYWEELIAPQD